MPTAWPLFVLGIGSQGGVGQGCPIPQHTPPLLRKRSRGARWPEKGPTEFLPGPSFEPRSGSMAPDSGLSASPAKWDASERGVRGCAGRVPSTLLLLLTYLTYLVLGTCVFWVLESPAAHDSSRRFQHEKWALLRNFTCLDGPALDSLIRVRGESGRPGRGGAGAAERTGTERKGTARLRSGHRQEHFFEIKWKARTRGRLGARLAGWRPESWAGWTPMQRARLGREKCAARRPDPRVRGERALSPPCLGSCVAQASKSQGDGDRGRADGVQGWWGPTGSGQR